MTALFTIFHVIVCLVLILAVLLQSGKSADLAGAFGGVGSQSAFGPRGAQTLLSKVTTFSAVAFMVTSFGLFLLSGRQTGSVLSGEDAPVKEQVETTAPAKAGEQAGEVDAKGAAEKKAPDTKQEAKKPPEEKKATTKKDANPPEKK
jgi:preprotein translocase subunit SecG